MPIIDYREKRIHKRMPARINLSASQVGEVSETIHVGSTLNVSSGGLYFKTHGPDFEAGTLLKLDLSIPPTAGTLKFGGRFSGFARVLRTDNLSKSVINENSGHCRRGVAAKFCKPLQLSL